MRLGDAIGAPSNEIDSALRAAVEGVLAEKSAAAAALREVLDTQSKILTQLAAVTDQLAAAGNDLASSARSLSLRTTMPAPEVNVTVPTPGVTVNVPEANVQVAAPNVSVDAPVTVTEEHRRVRKHVVRDPVTNLITDVIEETI